MTLSSIALKAPISVTVATRTLLLIGTITKTHHIAMTKLYPKGTIRRIVKAHEPNHKLSKSADVLVNLHHPFDPLSLRSRPHSHRPDP
jgi:hypothetical protein